MPVASSSPDATAPPASSYPLAGRHWPSLLTFLLPAVAIVFLDLTSKSMAYRLVPEVPIVLVHPDDFETRRSANGGAAKIVASNRPQDIPQASEGRELIHKLLHLRLTTNTGAVFGIGKGAQWLFTAISVVAIAVIGHVFWHSRRGSTLLHVCLGLILAGALGNLYDRIMFNAVRDFIYLFPGVDLPFGLHWPNGESRLYPWIFNVADMSLVIGVTLVLAIMWRDDRNRQHKLRATARISPD